MGQSVTEREEIFSGTEIQEIGFHKILHEYNRTDEFTYSQVRLNGMYKSGSERVEKSPLHTELGNNGN